MRVPVPCPECFNKALDAGEKTPSPNFISGEVDGEGIVHVSCPKGHAAQVVYDAPRYKILVDSAARAYLDGYTNEVVAVLAAALERAYEFYLRVLFRAKGIPTDLFNAAWKEIAKQSERQFGAFHMLHLLSAGAILELDPAIPKIRNKVIHSGHIIREDEALKFAELVFSRIRSIEKELEAKYGEHMIAEKKAEVERQKKLIPENVPQFVASMSAVIVDNATDVATQAERFLEVAGAIYNARKKGWE